MALKTSAFKLLASISSRLTLRTTAVRSFATDETVTEASGNDEAVPEVFDFAVKNATDFNIYSYYDIDNDCDPHRQVQPTADFKEDRNPLQLQ